MKSFWVIFFLSEIGGDLGIGALVLGVPSSRKVLSLSDFGKMGLLGGICGVA